MTPSESAFPDGGVLSNVTDPTVHHVGIRVADLERAVEFYRDALGLSVLKRFEVSGEAFATAVDVEGASASFAHLEGDDVRVEVVAYDPKGEPRPAADLNQRGAPRAGG